MSKDKKAWFALYTKPRNEFKAAEQLEAIGVEFYLPVITKLKQWSDRKKKVTEPLLRGYIFINADEKERLRSIEQRAIIRCLFDGGRPAVIPDWQIENLRLMLETKGEFFVRDGLIPGVKVLIKSGPFEGVTGIFSKIENERQFAVTIDTLNRSVIVHLPPESELEILKE